MLLTYSAKLFKHYNSNLKHNQASILLIQTLECLLKREPLLITILYKLYLFLVIH
jgi:hypothetical protein